MKIFCINVSVFIILFFTFSTLIPGSNYLQIGLAVASDSNVENNKIANSGNNNDYNSVKNISEVDIENKSIEQSGDEKDNSHKGSKKKYPFLNIVIVLIVLYGITYSLARMKKIKMINHKKIWNILLTISFLITAGTGILLTVSANAGNINVRRDSVLYWHVIAGIIMMVITFFHMGWHWRYYKNLFR